MSNYFGIPATVCIFIFVTSFPKMFKSDFSSYFVLLIAYHALAPFHLVTVFYCFISLGVISWWFHTVLFQFLPFSFQQLPVEVTSQVRRELCCPQTTPIITPEVRAVSMTSSSLVTLVSIISRVPLNCCLLFSQLMLIAHI